MKLKLYICLLVLIIYSCQVSECITTIENVKEFKVTGGSNRNPPEWSSDCDVSITADFIQRDAIEVFKNCSSRDSYGPVPQIYAAANIPQKCDNRKWIQNRLLAVINKVISKEWNYCHHHAPTWVPQSNFQQQFEASQIGSGKKYTGSCAQGAKNPNNQFIGLDSAGFVSWVYNYAFGTHFVDLIGDQACGTNAPGRSLNLTAKNVDNFQPGDILYIGADEISKPVNLAHAVIWTGIQATNDDSAYSLNKLMSNVPQFQKENVQKDIDSLKQMNIPIYVIADSHANGQNFRPFAGFYLRSFAFARRIVFPADNLATNIPGATYKDEMCFFTKPQSPNNAKKRLKLK
jgi:hypothetical protein